MTKHRSSLMRILQKLERTLKIPRIVETDEILLQGKTYVIVEHESFTERELTYQDKIATAHFTIASGPTLNYFVSASYIDGQRRLLESTNTRLGKEIADSLPAHAEIETNVKVPGKKRMQKTHLADIFKKIEMPDFSEAYQFILKHILYR